MYMTRTYYSIVCTRHIHSTDMSVHVYARWSGFQMIIREKSWLATLGVMACSLVPPTWSPRPSDGQSGR